MLIRVIIKTIKQVTLVSDNFWISGIKIYRVVRSPARISEIV